MADRMIVMNGGVAEQIGTPLEVYEAPRTLFAAQFIGSPAMNVFDAEIRGGKINLGGQAVASASENTDGDIKLGVRPEHLVIDDNGEFPVTVQLSEPLGANTLLHGQLETTGDEITVSLPGVSVPNPGSNMRFSTQQSMLHIFDEATGRRINLQGGRGDAPHD